jgi:hypothetical protein
MNALPVGLRRLGGILGTIFQGRRNLYDVFGYTRNPTFQECMAKYSRQDIAGRVIDAPAVALWTNPPQITSNTEDWDAIWQDLTIQLSLYEKIERLDKLAGIGKYSVLLVGYNDGMPLDQPVNARKVAGVEKKVLYLQPYSCNSAEIVKYVDNVSSEHYMKPEIYKINPKNELDALGQPKTGGLSGVAAKGLAPFNVHYSRILHICENPLENEVWGSPRIERVYNILDDLLKVTGGTAETFWLTANRGLHIDVDKDLQFGPEDEKGLSDEVDEYTHNLRRVIRTRGVKVNALGAETPDPRGAYEILISTLSGATGIPRRILTGSEAGQLASEQDRANWADRQEERRADFGNPRILIPLLKAFTVNGVLPAPDDIEITINWPSAFKMSPLENAQTSAQHARSATNFASAIEKMEKLRMGEPGSPDTTDANGNVVPGKPGREGVDLEDLVTIDEARAFIGLDKPETTINSSSDLIGQARKKARVYSKFPQLAPSYKILTLKSLGVYRPS